MASDLLLTDRERARLTALRSTLAAGENPYSTIRNGGSSPDARMDRKDKINTPRVEVDDSEIRRAKFYSTVGKFRKVFIHDDPDAVPIKATGPVCISCHNYLNVITSVYGTISTRHVTSYKDSVINSDPLILERSTISYDVPVTGHVCRDCFDTLWNQVSYGKDGNILRGIILKEEKKQTTKETISKNHRSQVHTVPISRPVSTNKEVKQGQPIRKLVTRPVALDRDGDVVRELRCKLPRREEEPVDVRGYQYVNRSTRNTTTPMKSGPQDHHGPVKILSPEQITRYLQEKEYQDRENEGHQ